MRNLCINAVAHFAWPALDTNTLAIPARRIKAPQSALLGSEQLERVDVRRRGDVAGALLAALVGAVEDRQVFALQVRRALDTSLINISRINNTLMFSSSTQS